MTKKQLNSKLEVMASFGVPAGRLFIERSGDGRGSIEAASYLGNGFGTVATFNTEEECNQEIEWLRETVVSDFEENIEQHIKALLEIFEDKDDVAAIQKYIEVYYSEEASVVFGEMAFCVEKLQIIVEDLED